MSDPTRPPSAPGPAPASPAAAGRPNPSASPDASPDAGLLAELRGWSAVAIGSLAVSGALALLLVLSRVPATQVLLPWSWQSFFYAALVTHVILSFVVWFLAVLGALAVLAVARGDPAAPSGTTEPLRCAMIGRLGVIAAAVGAVLLLVPTLLNEGEPSLNNYVPILGHPIYYLGLALVAIGVALPVVRLLLNPQAFVTNAGFGTAVAGCCYLIALACMGIAWVSLPDGLDSHTLNERLFWGGGHILQFVNTALMLTAWALIAETAFGIPPVPPGLFRVVMGSLLLFSLPGPLFYALYPVLGLAHRLAFTDLLWYGLLVQPVVVGTGMIVVLIRNGGGLRNPTVAGLAVSAMLFLAGGVMGFFLGPSDARTPSHYHASIGGVNLAFMVLFAAVILPALGRELGRRWLVALPYHLYGWGQLVFSIGMFIAGAAGVPRKTMGAEAQGIDSVVKSVAMGIYGAGGGLAILGGVIFIALVLARLGGRTTPVPAAAAANDPSPPLPTRTGMIAPAPGQRLEPRLVLVIGGLLGLLWLAMPAWRGLTRAEIETAPMELAAFERLLADMTARHTIETREGGAVVRPPAGDVYLAAERWQFTPVLELEAGRSYRIHVTSRDLLHGVVIGGREALLTPGTVAVLPFTPDRPGPVSVVCSEYCGLDHNKMKGLITVIQGEASR